MTDLSPTSIFPQTKKYLSLLSFQWRVVIFKIDLERNQSTPMTSYDEGISSFDMNHGHFAFAKITIHNPSELYTADENLKVLKLLTQFNTAWLADKSLVTLRSIVLKMKRTDY